jgi:hypothetical protein
MRISKYNLYCQIAKKLEEIGIYYEILAGYSGIYVDRKIIAINDCEEYKNEDNT